MYFVYDQVFVQCLLVPCTFASNLSCTVLHIIHGLHDCPQENLLGQTPLVAETSL